MFTMQQKKYLVGVLSLFITLTGYAATISSTLYSAEGSTLGTVTFEDHPYGLLIKPKLSGLAAGQHGFHIHQHPDCGDHGMNAGSHFDPGSTNSHQGPYGEGHLGDLPVLIVSDKGEVNTPMLAPRLSTQQIKGHAVMIHAGGDNYTDTPPLGGGGARIGCGTIS